MDPLTISKLRWGLLSILFALSGALLVVAGVILINAYLGLFDTPLSTHLSYEGSSSGMAFGILFILFGALVIAVIYPIKLRYDCDRIEVHVARRGRAARTRSEDE